MLPNLRLPVPGPSGVGYVIARDLPVAAFFLGYPVRSKGTRSSAWRTPDKAAETWADGVIARGIIDPVLTPEMLHRLGPDRDVLVTAYFRAVGWLAANDDTLPATADEPVVTTPIPADLIVQSVARMPAPTVQDALRFMHTRTRFLPHVIWSQWYISEYAITWRMLKGEPGVADSLADDPFDAIPTEFE